MPSPTPFVAEELKSEIPFLTKEPEAFQAEFVITANENERKNLVARNGENRRYDYNIGEEIQLSLLKTDKNYLIFPQQKIYTETSTTEIVQAANDWTNFLTVEWLSAKNESKFEKLETVENITKYRILVDNKEVSETIIFVDENQKIPVKQEFFSINGEQKTLLFTFEIRNLKLQPDDSLFIIPTDFKKVSSEEFRKQINLK